MATSKWTPQSLGRRIKPIAVKWAAPLGLDRHWEIDFDVYDEQSVHDPGHGYSAAFEVHSDWRYLAAHVTAFGPVVANMSDDEMERAILHEYGHILVNELATCHDDAKTDSEERVVSTLTAALLAARDMGRKERK